MIITTRYKTTTKKLIYLVKFTIKYELVYQGIQHVQFRSAVTIPSALVL